MEGSGRVDGACVAKSNDPRFQAAFLLFLRCNLQREGARLVAREQGNGPGNGVEKGVIVFFARRGEKEEGFVPVFLAYGRRQGGTGEVTVCLVLTASFLLK